MNPRESNPDRFLRRLRGEAAIVEATLAARSFGSAQGLSADDLARLCIVVEELIANLYDHGGLTGDDEVELSLVAEAGAIRVTIVDSGKPFDPQSQAPGAASGERGGGAGLALVHAWAEILSYEGTAAGNRLELLIPLRARRN